MLPTAAGILAAAHRLRGVIERTPLIPSSALSAIAGTDVFLKCENRQRTGSFKLRGAYNALATLPRAQRERGIVASSAGNHGLGVAHAARLLGIRARIFVPCTAPAVKRDGIRAMGADVDDRQPHYDAAHEAALAWSAAHGVVFVHPCAGEALLAGQGTVAVEIIEELPDVRTIVAPVGGAGLISGMAAFVRAVTPSTRMVGAQGDVTNALALSLEAGHRVEIQIVSTLADGLSGQADDDAFALARGAVDEMCVVTEEEIAGAIAWLARDHDLRVEGAGAVAAAVVRAGRRRFAGPTAVVVSGGNIDDARWLGITAPA